MILFAAVVAAVSGVPGALEGSVRVVRGRRLLSEASMRPRSTPSRTSFCEVQPSTCSTSSRPYGSPIWTLSTRAAKARGATALCLLLPHERDDLTALHLHARAHHAQMVELGMDAGTVTTALDLEEGLLYLKRAAGPSPHRNGFAGCSP